MVDSANTLVKDENFISDALKRDLHILQQSTNRSKNIEIEAERWKMFDDMLVDLAEKRLLDNATGVYLEELARTVGLDTVLDDDESTRTAIKIRGLSRQNATSRGNIVYLISLSTGMDEEDIYIYRGENNVIDIIIHKECSDLYSIPFEITRILPVLAKYTIERKASGNIFGLCTLDEEGNDVFKEGYGGFCSVGNFDVTGEYGALVSIVLSAED